MAQALLNNLNISKDNNFVVNDNTTKSVATDFAKIFDKQTTVENSADNSSINTETPSEDIKSVMLTTIEKILSPDGEACTLGDLKIDLNTNETLRAEFEKAVQESIADTVVDLTIIKDILVETDDADVVAEDTENLDDELNPIIEEEIETIITEEDPTMYKELNTLENPTVAIMLHSQIQTAVKNVTVTKSDAEKTDDNCITFRQTESQNLNNNNNVFKKFDASTTKDITANLTKEDSIIKTEPSKLNKAIDEKFVKDLNIQVMETECQNEASSNDLMQQQTPQEQVAKVMIQGAVKFDKLQFDAIKMTEIRPTEITSGKIIEQISKQIDGMYNNSKLNIVLNPEHLGKVNLQVINSKEGLLAQFTVTTQEAKDLLMKGLNGLKENLLSQGINVDSVSIKLEESKESEGQSDWTEQEGSRGGNKQQGSRKQQKEQEKPFEQMMFELNNDGKV